MEDTFLWKESLESRNFDAGDAGDEGDIVMLPVLPEFVSLTSRLYWAISVGDRHDL